MSTACAESLIAGSLFGKVRRSVLSLLFGHPDESFYLREIAQATGSAVGAVQRELRRLVRAGLVSQRRQGNQVYYPANRRSPVFPELRGLMVKTCGVADVLREALAGLAERIELAFIYGSVAQGTEQPESDVNVMVIGDVTFGEVADAVRTAEERLQREVNGSVYRIAEVRERLARHDHFLTSVIRGPRIFLIGDEGGLARLAG